MKTPIRKISRQTYVVIMETLAVVIFLAAAGYGALFWRLSQGPMSIGFAKDYVEEALSDKDQGIAVSFDDMVVSWPALDGPFHLDLTNLRVRKGVDRTEANTLRIPKASIGLSRRALLIGRVRPVSVVIKAPSIELVRGADGRLSLFMQERELTHQDNAAPAARPEEEVARLFKDMATRKKGSALARLSEFVIEDASVAIRDYQVGISWYLSGLDFSIERHPQGVAATVNAALPGGRERNAHVNVSMVYRQKSDDFRAEADLQNINPYIISRFLPLPDALGGQDLYFSGKIEGAMDGALTLTGLKFSGAIPSGQISLPEEYDAPIAIRNVRIVSDYSGQSKTLTLSELSGEIDGVPLSGEGKGVFEPGRVSVPVKMKVKAVSLEKVAALFPKSERDGEAYHWLGERLKGGGFQNASLSMELVATPPAEQAQASAEQENGEGQEPVAGPAQWNVHLPKFLLDFDFDGVTVSYSDTLMPAEKASGHGVLDLAAETLDITGGRATLGGDVAGSDVSVNVTDLMESKKGYVKVKAVAKGPLATALRYIAAEPVNMGKEEIGLDAATVKGTIDAVVEVGLPTIKDVPKEDVNVSINGTLDGLNIPGIVEGLDLSGGPLTLATEEGGFRVKGSAQLARRAMTLDWHQFFSSEGRPYSMQIVADIGADQELRNHFGVDLDDYISGTLPVNVTYTRYGNGDSDVGVKGDLAPITVHIDPFKFEKKPGVAGSVTLKASLKKDVLKEISGLEIKSDQFSISGGRLNFAAQNGKKADLAKATIASAVIGKTRLAVNVSVSDKNVMTVKASGPAFDLEPFLREAETSSFEGDQDIAAIRQAAAAARGGSRSAPQPMNITLNADKMFAKNGRSIDKPRLYLETDKDGDITRLEMDGRLGDGNLLVRFRPDASLGGKRTFRMTTNDAGSALDAFGLYQNIRGGSLLVYGEPKGGNLRGDLYGVARMENFRVVKAPALARLLSLMSLSGVTQLLSNEGLLFSKLEAQFEWRFRKAGNLLVIKEGKTSGSSIGLTFSGVMDRGQKTTDISGTIIPMTEVNLFIGKIPLIGNILGGSTGLIAATYTMKGPSGDPGVSINPLSVLTPGFLRRILFEGGYESKIPGDEKAAGDKAKDAAPKKSRGVNTRTQQTKPQTPN